MRVALVCPYSISVPGGVQGQVLGLAAALERRGHDVALVAPVDAHRAATPGPPGGGPVPGGPVPSDPTAGGPPPGDPVPGRPVGGIAPGVQLLRAGSSLRVPVNGSRAPVAIDPLAMRRALRALGSFRPDLLHVHEPFVPGVGLAALAAHRAPVVGTFHRSGSGALYRAARPLARAAIARVDDVVAVSDAARATLEEVLGRQVPRCDIVSNGVDLDRFATVEPWPSLGPTIMFMGRHERRKGLAVLLEAFAQLAGGTRLWVVGSGPETQSLRSRFAGDGRVEWCGQLADGDLARRLVAADVLVAPSLGGESFGVVLLEAMAAGTAVVASDIDGYRLAAGDAARLVPPGDPEQLATTLRLLVDDAELRGRLVRAGHVRAEGRSLEAVAEQYATRYESVLAGPVRRDGRRRRNGDRRSS